MAGKYNVVVLGDKTSHDSSTCRGKILTGDETLSEYGVAGAREGHVVTCGKHPGGYKILGDTSDSWDNNRRPAGTLDSVSSCPCRARFIPSIADGYIRENTAEEWAENACQLAPATPPEQGKKPRADQREHRHVFAKSCLRGEGCHDAGEQPEPHTNFAERAFYQALPATDPASDTDVPQHAQTAKKKKQTEDIPEPKKRSALYKWWFGNHEEMDYQAAKAAAVSTASAQTAPEGTRVLGLVGRRAMTSGTWAASRVARHGDIATGIGRVATRGPGAPIAALLAGMMSGRLNDSEQDLIDRMRREQMHEAPTRVRYTWENNSNVEPVPHGWHTPPGKDNVRVRKMAWGDTRKAYTFTTEEEKPVTLIWTPDSSGVNVPENTGNQTPPRIPSLIVVNPLPDKATTRPAPEEKAFADYILILPLPYIPPIYIYLRNNPGQVTGYGQKVSGIWLSDANTENRSPVPSQIANRFSGRAFGNFDQFSKAFWLEISKDPELSRQFKRGNAGNIRTGKAPAPKESEQVGGKIKSEIHHIKSISEGSEVYNVDNMGIVTPKHHIEIHGGR